MPVTLKLCDTTVDALLEYRRRCDELRTVMDNTSAAAALVRCVEAESKLAALILAEATLQERLGMLDLSVNGPSEVVCH